MNTINASVKTETATTSKKFAFTFDHVNKKIVGTDINFQKAGIPDSKEEKELNARMEARPTYGFTVLPTEKKPAKQTYKGLGRELMREYIGIQKEAVKYDLMAQLDKMIEDKIAQPTIKSWFLEEFPGFTVSKAKREIQQHKLITTKADVRKVKTKVKNNITEFAAVAQIADQRKVVNE